MVNASAPFTAEATTVVLRQRLSALLDGLAMQAVLHPRRTTPDILLDVLRRNVHSLATA